MTPKEKAITFLKGKLKELFDENHVFANNCVTKAIDILQEQIKTIEDWFNEQRKNNNLLEEHLIKMNHEQKHWLIIYGVIMIEFLFGLFAFAVFPLPTSFYLFAMMVTFGVTTLWLHHTVMLHQRRDRLIRRRTKEALKILLGIKRGKKWTELEKL